MQNINEIRKAILACAIAAVGALSTALIDNGVTAQEWCTVALAGLVALGGVWAVPNAQKPVVPPKG